MIFLLRLVGAVIFGSLGNFLGRESIPPNAPIQVPVWTGVATTIIFAVTGFLVPDIISFLARVGIVKLAQELTKHIPTQLPKTPIRIKLPKRAKNNHNPQAVIADTSAIVDGRIFEIVKTGFFAGDLIIIPDVLSELQHLADSANDIKRLRGRTALDALQELKKQKGVRVKILTTDTLGKTTDEKLVEVAKKQRAKILTSDFNLGKVAKLANLSILNVNELAQAVRMQFLPGEEFEINLVHAGKSKNQGVGYLTDGTMVVVEDGEKYLGSQIQVKVHRSLQTVAGRMVFARVSREIARTNLF